MAQSLEGTVLGLQGFLKLGSRVLRVLFDTKCAQRETIEYLSWGARNVKSLLSKGTKRDQRNQNNCHKAHIGL